MTAQEPQKPLTSTTDSTESRSSSAESSRSPGATTQGRLSETDRATTETSVDDSPELLRWRADILLDEMMLGAVDAGSAGYNDARAQISEADASNQAAPRSGHYENGFTSPPATSMPRQASPDSGPSPAYGETPYGDRPHGDRPQYDGRQADGPLNTEYADYGSPPGRPPSGTYYEDRGDVAHNRDAETPAPPRDAWSDSWRADRPSPPPSYDRTPVEPPRPTDSQDRAPYSASAYSSPGAYSAPESAPDVDYLRRPYAAAEQNHAGASPTDDALLRPPTAAQNHERAEQGGLRRGAFRRDEGTSRRNNLLPRMSETDVAQLRQDMTQLTAEVEQFLPLGHDWYARSEHLLERADHILRTTPERSAEVEYYLQQVRAILQRAQQTNTASLAYRKRLIFYHAAWLVLSLIGLATFVLYRQSFTTWLVSVFGLDPSGFMVGHVAAFAVTMAAATLGAALGGLWNMRRYLGQGRGFFDRKYGLRGLLLPAFALLAATIVYAIFALVCWMINLVPLDAPMWVIVPASVAFVFGFWQEHIYGTAA
jgi:hypothetical protein